MHLLVAAGLVAAGLAVLAIVTATVLGHRARRCNDELALPSPPLARALLLALAGLCRGRG